MKKTDYCRLFTHGFCRIPLVLLTFFASLFVLSCDMMNVPVRKYFEDWTNEVAIVKFEVDGVESYYDKDGNLCIPSGNDVPITLFMRNPYHYVLGSSEPNPGLQNQYGYAKEGPYITSAFDGGFSGVVSQDADDTTLLKFTYGSAYLVEKERGGEVGGEVTVLQPFNGVDNKFSFSLKCNSKPPVISDVSIMKGTDSGGNEVFVLAFARPDVSGIHSDIVSININGTDYPVSTETGKMTFGDNPKFSTNSQTLEVINRGFTHNEGKSAYFFTGEPFIEGQKTYTIGLMDSAGLKSSYVADTSVIRVSSPVVKNNDGNVLSDESTNSIHIDYNPDVEYSTVEIEVPTTDEAGNTGLTGVTVKWELKQGSEVIKQDGLNYTDNIGSSSSEVNLKIPDEGNYTLRVWAEKGGLKESETRTYNLSLVYTQLRNPAVKKGTDSLVTGSTNYIEGPTQSLAVVAPVKDVTNRTLTGSEVTLTYALDDGTETSGNGSISLETGLHTLTVTASKPGYKESSCTYSIKIFDKDIYVKGGEGGSDTTGDGTQLKPYATIKRAVQDIATYNCSTLEYTIHILDTVKGSQQIGDNVNNRAAKITLQGENNAGVLDGNQDGIVLYVQGKVEIDIKNLTITNGKTPTGAGIYASANTKINILSGTKITSNTTTSGGGGGVFVADKGTVVLDGGTIGGSSSEKNTSVGSGGGVYVVSGGTFTIKSGTISHNTAKVNGGGIYNAGTCNIEGGSISGNNAGTDGQSGSGGGVYNAKTCTMKSGSSVAGNYTTSTGSGGEVYTSSSSSDFDMQGGTVGGSTASTAGKGKGIFVGGSFKMSGTAKVSDANDVYIDGVAYSDGKTINITDTLTNDTVAKITPSSWVRGNKVLSGAVSANYSKFKVSDSDWDVILHDSVGRIDADIYVAPTSGTLYSCTGYGDDTNGLGTKSKPCATVKTAVSKCWDGSKTDGYTIYIDGKVTGAQEIPSSLTTSTASAIKLKGTNANATLDAEGSASQKRTTLTIGSSVPVTVETLKITGGYNNNGGGIYLDAGKTLKLGSGAKVMGNTAAEFGGGGGVYCSGGTVFMYGNAEIGDSSLGDGEYSNSTVGNASSGAGLYCTANAKIYIGYTSATTKDSSFSGGFFKNKANFYGGAICAADTTVILKMNKGKINGNYADYNGGGAYLESGFDICDVTMEGNEANEGGAVFVRDGYLGMSGSSKITYGSAAGKNDVFLDGTEKYGEPGATQCRILVSSNLTAGAATITLPYYSDGRQVIIFGEDYSWFYGKIGVKASTWCVGPDGMLHLSAAGAAAKIKATAENSTFVVTGNLSADDFATIKEALLHELDYRQGVRITLDFTKATFTTVPYEAFRGCANLVGIKLPKTVTTIGDFAFYGCTNLALINLPDSISKFTTGHAFGHCSSITSLTIPEGVTSVGREAFLECTDLTSVKLPSTLTKLESRTFYMCSALTSVTIPVSVTEFEDQLFYSSGVTTITYKGTKAQWNAITKHSSWKSGLKSGAIVKCTDGNITP